MTQPNDGKFINRPCATNSGSEVRNVRESENYGRHLLQGEFLVDGEWEVGIWLPDGKYVGTLIGLYDRSLDLVAVEATNDAT